MTKGTKIFRITISVLLALIIAWGAFMTYGFMFFAKNYIHRDAYGIWIAGVSVTRANKDDILGDGKVSYNAYSNMLTFDNAIIESGSSLDVAVNSGSTEACNGVCVDGNLVVGKDAAVNVSVDDEIAQISECIGVSGIMSIGRNATVTASSKKTYAIKCYGTMETGEGATLTSSNAGEGADIFCYSTFVNEGAVVNAEINALGGIYYNEDLETNS